MKFRCLQEKEDDSEEDGRQGEKEGGSSHISSQLKPGHLSNMSKGTCSVKSALD
jgi:hypothetical protein